jgi:hypothetical protein
VDAKLATDAAQVVQLEHTVILAFQSVEGTSINATRLLAPATNQMKGRALSQVENSLIGRLGPIEIAAAHATRIALIALVEIDDEALAHGSFVP